MDSTIFGISPNTNFIKTPTAKNDLTKLSSEDFMKILIAEMSQPNISSIFNSAGQSSASSSSLFGNSNLSSMLAMGNFIDTQSSFTEITELPILSLLIGKHIKATDSNNKEISGTVQRILMQNGSAMVDIGDSQIIYPTSIKEIK